MTRTIRERVRPFARIGVASLALLAAFLVCSSLAPAARAQSSIYWTWGACPFCVAGPSGIGRANLDGTGVDQNFITFHGRPAAIAIDGTHIYWTSPLDSTISRANLDGTGVEGGFITGIAPHDVAVDAGHIYWTSGSVIGRANLDGTGVEPRFIETPPGVVEAPRFFGVAVEGGNIYWAFQNFPISSAILRSIGCANLDGTGVNYELITANARDVALDGAHVYWATTIGVGRANRDGTAAQEGFIPAHGDSAVAVDGAHIYWNGAAGGGIGRANRDGTGVDQSFITGVAPTAVAVGGAPSAPSGQSTCPPPPPRPSNDFSFGKLKRNLKKGTAKLTVKVPGPGQLGLAETKRLRSDSTQAAAAGKIRLRVRPHKKTWPKFARRGKLKVSARVTFSPTGSPTGGEPNTESKQLKLKRR
jgi:virginiamycin B lyase